MDNSSSTVPNYFSLPRGRDGARLGRALSTLSVFAFGAYTAFALAWLCIGLLPPLASAFPLFRLTLADLAASVPLLSTLAKQIIYISLYGFMDPDSILVRVTGTDATFQYLFSIVNIALGIALLRLRPHDRVAFLLAIGMIGTAAVFNWQSHSVIRVIPDLGITAHDWFHILAGEAYVLAMLLFPDGWLPGWHLRKDEVLPRKFLARSAGAGLFAFAILMGFALPSWVHGSYESFVSFFGFFIPLIGLSAQAIRFFDAPTPIAREQSRVLLWGLGAIFLLALLLTQMPLLFGALRLPGAPPRAIQNAALAFFPLLITTIPLLLGAILVRYHLWDIDRVINRAVVYGLLTAIVLGGYAVLVGGLAALWSPFDDVWIKIIATGFIAILFHPLRERLQRVVNRVMYGRRDEPFAVLNHLGAQLENSPLPDTGLLLVVETICKNLRVPYAAIELITDDGIRNTHYGTLNHGTIALPLRYQNETIGTLQISRRAHNENFSPADLQLLENLARQAGAIACMARLNTQLQQSREHIIGEREQERKRLRRELHDGLGPTLASQTLKLDAALDLLDGGDAANAEARKILQALKTQTQRTVTDIRRIAYELRPPALDDLGLAGALRAHLDQANGVNGLHISFDAPAELLPLSAAVQVNAYRIVLEAVNNVVKHAQAANCAVRIASNGVLSLEIRDDGIGLEDHVRLGVGMTSMRERAEELGGTFKIENNVPKGTRVLATLPISPLS